MDWHRGTIVRRRKTRHIAEGFNPRQARDAHGRWTVSGMAPAVAAEVVPFEKRVAAEEHARNPRPGYGTTFGPERGMIVDARGTVLWTGTGEATRIEGSALDVLGPGVTMTHFHPSDHARAHLSTGDVETSLSTGATIRAFNANGAWQQFTPNGAGQHLGISLQDLYPHMKDVGGDMEDALSTVLKGVTSSKGTWQEGSHAPLAEADTNEFGSSPDPGSSSASGSPYSDEFRTKIIRGDHRGKAILDAERAEQNLYRLTDDELANLKALLDTARKDTIDALSKATKDWQVKDRQAILDQLDQALGRFQSGATVGLQNLSSVAWAAGAEITSGVNVSTLPHIDTKALSIALMTSPDLITNIRQDIRDSVATQLRLAMLGQASPLDLMKALGTTTGKGVFASAFARGEAIYRTEVGRIFQTAAHARALQLEAQLPGWQKEWHAVHDSRTRFDHVKADGQRVGVNEPFDIGGYKAQYPHDPNLPARESVNCRCISIPVRPEWDFIRPQSDTVTPEGEAANDVNRFLSDALAKLRQATRSYWDEWLRYFEASDPSRPTWSRTNGATNAAESLIDRNALARAEMASLDAHLAEIMRRFKGGGPEMILAVEKELRRLIERLRAEVIALDAEMNKIVLPTGAAIGSQEWEIAWAKRQQLGSEAGIIRQMIGVIESRIRLLRINLPIGDRVLPRPTKETFGSGGKKLAEVQRAYDDALALAKALEALGFKTKWTGAITYGGAGRSAATFGWDGTININANTFTYSEASFRKVLLHELLHGVSGSTPHAYGQWPGWEEGVVERAAQFLEPQMRASLGLDDKVGYNSYKPYTDALHTLWTYAYDATGIGEYDFILTLVSMPLEERPLWVGRQIDESKLPPEVLLRVRDAGRILRSKRA